MIMTDGCGFSIFQGLSFVAAEREDAKAPVFNLSWNGDSDTTKYPGFSGAALQFNNFYDCSFIGGTRGLSVATAGLMGSSTTIVNCDFIRSGIGFASCGYNALANNMIGCLFKGNTWAAAQADGWGAAPLPPPAHRGVPAPAGAFNLFNSRLEGSKVSDIDLKNSASDCFYIKDTTSTSPTVLVTGHTGAPINTLFEEFRYLGATSTNPNLVIYQAGGSCIFLNSDLAKADVKAISGMCPSSLIMMSTVFHAIGAEGTAQSFVFRSTGVQVVPDAENLFADGDFEAQPQAPCRAGTAAGTVHLYEGNPAPNDASHKGQYCLGLDLKSETAVFSFGKPVNVDASKTYCMSVSVYIPTKTRVYCTGYAYSKGGVQVKDEKGVWAYGLGVKEGPMEGWQKAEITLGPKGSSTDFTWRPETDRIGMNVYLRGEQGTVYLDDITVKEEP